MALTNLRNAINKLGEAKLEYGVNAVKKAKIAAAKTSLAASLVSDTQSDDTSPLTAAQIAKIKEAFNQANLAIELSEGAVDSPHVNDVRFNEPYHLKTAFDLAVEANALGS